MRKLATGPKVRARSRITAARPHLAEVAADQGHCRAAPTAAGSRYQGAVEELSPLRADPWSALPLGAVSVALLISPAAADLFLRRAITAYSVAPLAAHRMAPPGRP